MCYAYLGTRIMLRVPFIDRRVELGVLEREYAADGFRLVVVYGRRRVGKTRLLREWLRGKRGVYFVAAELSYRQLCEEFADVVGVELGLYVPRDDIVAALERLAGLGERLVVVLDEFQYFVDADPSLPSRLARSIDTRLSNSNMVIVLCGSAVSFFEKELLGYRAPLHGRRTSQLKLRPMRLLEAYGFAPKLDPSDMLRVYSMVGGTPAYLARIYGVSSLEEAVERVIEPGNPLLEEAENLLRQELREPRTYMAILAAIAAGRRASSEIAQATRVDARNIHRYVSVLEELEIVSRRTPLGYRRGTRIFIVDDYFRFWFRYILKLRSHIEAGYTDEAKAHIMETIDQHAAETFVRFVKQHLPELHRLNIVKPIPVEHGPWWHRGMEIDLVVRELGKATAFIEAKWSNLDKREALEILGELEEKARHTGLQSPTNYYILVARRIEDQKKPVEEHANNRITVDYEKLIKALKNIGG